MSDFAITTVDVNTSTGTQDITISGFGTPVAALFFMGVATSSDNDSTGSISFGMTDGTREYCAGRSGRTYSFSAYSASNTSSYCIEIQQGATNPVPSYCRANFDSWITDGVRIDWDGAPSSAWKLHVVLIGGSISSSDVYCGTFSSPSDNGSTDITDPGFQPDLIFTTTASTSSNYSVCFGVRDRANDKNFGTFHRTSSYTSYAYRVADNRVAGLTTNLGTGAAIYIDDEDSNGFTVYDDGAGSGMSLTHRYLAIKLPTGYDLDIYEEEIPTSTGNEDTTGFNFEPNFCLGVNGMLDASLPAYENNNSNTNMMFVGGYDGTTEFSCGCSHEYNQWGADHESFQAAAWDAHDSSDTNNIDVTASTSFISTGIRRAYSAVSNSSTRYGWAMAYKEAASGTTHQVSGQSDLSLSTAGAIGLSMPLSGQSDIALSTAGAVGLSMPLAGQSDVTLTSSGSLVADIALSGQSDLALSTVAAIEVIKLISGQSDLSLSTTATVDVFKLISGQSDFSLSTSGNITGDLALAGQSDLALSTAGNMVATYGLSGASDLTLSTAGVLTATLGLSGTSAFSLSTSALLTRLLYLSGRSDLTLTTVGNLTDAFLLLSGRVNMAMSTMGTIYVRYLFATRKDFYAMIQIPIGASSHRLRFEYPAEWPGQDVSGLTLTVKNRLGETALSAQSATLYTATTLDGDAERFSSEIVLASGAGELAPGDPILIEGVEGYETHRVKGYDSTTRTVELEQILQNEHADGDAVHGLWGYYDIDVSDTDAYPAGLVLTLVWTPTGGGKPTTQAAQIAVSVLDVAGLDRRFARLYPRAHKSFQSPVGRMADMLDEAERQVRQELFSNNIDIERIVDQDVIAPTIMAKMAYLWALNGDDNKEDERQAILAEYERQVGILLNQPIWADHSQDHTQDDGETTSHEHVFEGGW